MIYTILSSILNIILISAFNLSFLCIIPMLFTWNMFAVAAFPIEFIKSAKTVKGILKYQIKTEGNGKISDYELEDSNLYSDAILSICACILLSLFTKTYISTIVLFINFLILIFKDFEKSNSPVFPVLIGSTSLLSTLLIIYDIII